MSEPQPMSALERLHRRMALATAGLLLPPFVLSLTWVAAGFRALDSPKSRMGIEIIGPWMIGGVLAVTLLGSAMILISCARARRAGGPAESRVRVLGLCASGLGLCAIRAVNSSRRRGVP